MKRCLTRWLATVVLSVVVCANPVLAESQTVEAPPKPALSGKSSEGNSRAVVPNTLAIVELILTNHIDPPTRQQMLLEGAKALLKAAKMVPPAELSQRISSLASAEQFQSFLGELWTEASHSKVPTDELEAMLRNGIFSAVPGEPREPDFIPAKELKVNEQLAGNRYIGIGIVLGTTNFSKNGIFPQVKETFKRGPAAKAGMKAGDLIINIDGVDMRDMKLAQVIDRLRGNEGSVVTVSVREPEAADTRTLRITRSVVPRETVVGFKPASDDGWELRVSSSPSIGYLRINEIGSSTVHELRKFERQLCAQGIQALTLDFRRADGSLHNTVLLADALLDGGRIGQVRTRRGLTTYDAEPDCLFRDWPLAVLTDRYTSAEAEWLVAALQDRKRAAIVGEPTSGTGFTVTSVPLADGSGAIMLATGLLERADARPLRRPEAMRARIPVVSEIANPKSRDAMAGVYPDYFVRREELDRRRNPVGIAEEEVRLEPRSTELALIKPSAQTTSANSPTETLKDVQLHKAIEVLRAILNGSK